MNQFKIVFFLFLFVSISSIANAQRRTTTFGSSFGNDRSQTGSSFGRGSSSDKKPNDGFGTTINPYDFRNDKGTLRGITRISMDGKTARTTYFHPDGKISTETSRKNLLETGWRTTHFNTDGSISNSITRTSSIGLTNRTTHFNGDGTLGNSIMHNNVLGTGSRETHFTPDGISSSLTRSSGFGSTTTMSPLTLTGTK